jgi:hypothetical protein
LIALVEFVFVVIPLFIALRSNHPLAWLGFPVSATAQYVIFAITISANNRDGESVTSRH